MFIEVDDYKAILDRAIEFKRQNERLLKENNKLKRENEARKEIIEDLVKASNISPVEMFEKLESVFYGKC